MAFQLLPVFLSGFWTPLLKFNNTIYSSSWMVIPLAFADRYVFKPAHNGLRVDVNQQVGLSRRYGIN